MTAAKVSGCGGAGAWAVHTRRDRAREAMAARTCILNADWQRESALFLPHALASNAHKHF